MTSSTAMKKEFLTKWAVALQMSTKDDEGGSRDKSSSSSVMLRKKAIKLSADVAMASTRSPSTLWSRALISNPQNSPIARRLLGTNKISPWTTLSKRGTRRIVKMNRKRKTRMMIKKKRVVNSGRSMARRMVKKRTEVLRSLVPGGEDMEEWRLIKEALDYVVCLRVQVDVMSLLANAAAASAGAGAANVYDDNPK